MKNIKAARRYAVALLAVAQERGAVDAVAADLEAIGRILAGSRDLRLLVASPIITASRKQAVFRELFGKQVAKETLLFITLLTAKQREALLPAVVEEFLALRDARANVVNVDVTAAVDLTPAQATTLSGTLERQTGKQVRLRTTRTPPSPADSWSGSATGCWTAASGTSWNGSAGGSLKRWAPRPCAKDRTMAEVRPEEVSAILRKQLAGFENEVEIYETGTVLQVGDGVARVYGLTKAR